MSARLAVRQLTAPAPDRELVAAYLHGRDAEAFAELVRRHGPAVRRAAADLAPAHADDVAQATFAVFARKAAAVAGRESAAGWLFETARRLAKKARTAAARRTKREANAPPPNQPADPLDELAFREVRRLVADELAALPDGLRVPLLLCYWEGVPHPAAAARLGCSLATYKRRLDAARDRLTARLARRGFAGAAVLSALVGMRSTAAVPPGLSPLAAELAAAGGRTLPLLGLTAVVVAIGLGLGVASGGRQPPDPARPGDAQHSQRPVRPGPQDQGADAPRSPSEALPPGAVARFGSPRLRIGSSAFASTADGK